jgi:hypothetical protein
LLRGHQGAMASIGLHGRNAVGAMACCVALALALSRTQAEASEPARLLRRSAESRTRTQGDASERTRRFAAQLRAQSDHVVLGRVLGVVALASGPRGEAGIHSQVTIEVQHPFQGQSPPTLTLWVQGGELGDRRRVLSGQAQFRTGETLLLFLRARPDGVLFPTAMGRGKWRWQQERNEVQPPDGAIVRLADVSNALGSPR